MRAHTPGPWEAVKNDGAYVKSGDLATWRVEERATATEMVVAVVISDVSLLKPEANARLIAAAPDLKALAVALDNFWTAAFPGGPDAPIDANGHFRLSDDTTALWRQCRAAIAKAEGRQ